MEVTQHFITKASALLQKFNSNWMEFLLWLNEFEFIVDCFRLSDSLKVKYLLNMVETSFFVKIQEHFHPVDPFLIPYDNLISELEQMFSRVHGESAFKFRFDHRDQMYGECVIQYLLALQKLLSQCSPEIYTRSNLLKRFIIGLRNINAYVKIMKHGKNITLDMAVSIALEFEVKEKKDIMKNMEIPNI